MVDEVKFFYLVFHIYLLKKIQLKMFEDVQFHLVLMIELYKDDIEMRMEVNKLLQNDLKLTIQNLLMNN